MKKVTQLVFLPLSEEVKNPLSGIVKLFIPLLMILILAAVSQTANSQTKRYVKAGGTGNGSSWAAASGDLQSMINTSAAGDQVWVAAGTYKPTTGTNRNAFFSLRNNLTIYGGFTGIETSLSQRNPSGNPTIISGDIGTTGDKNDNCYHVIVSNNNNNTAILDGFTIRDGNANSEVRTPFRPEVGGGMYTNNSSPSIINCTFTANNAYYGGGALCTDNNSNAIILNCRFLSNTGNAVYIFSSSPVITNCLFSRNSSNEVGGAIVISYSDRNASPVITNCTFSSNNAKYGAGAVGVGRGTPAFTNCIFWGNTPYEIFNNGAAPTFNYCNIQGGYGGTANLNVDPLFADAANGDYHLKPSSPVINKGNNTANTTTTDLDGNARIFGGTIDLGAYELQQAPCVSPAITIQPVAATKCTGEAVSFSVSATGTGLSYQWKKNGTNILGATSSAYNIDAVSTGDAGDYSVVVNGTCGSLVTSNAVGLTLNTKPVITVPTIATALSDADKCGTTVPFEATASGSPAAEITYKIGSSVITSPYFFPVGTTTVTATSTNTCGTDVKSFQVIVEDKTPPEVVVKNATVYSNASGTVNVAANDIYVSRFDNCGIRSYTSGVILNCSNTGNTLPVTLAISDIHGNVTRKTVQITVLDTIAPVVQAKEAVTLRLNASGRANLTVAEVLSAASTDNCGITSQQLSKTAFTCENLGENTVTLTVKDRFDNTIVKTIKVLVVDEIKPTVITQPVTVQLDAAGKASVTAAQINNGSSDNCTPSGVLKLALDRTDFTCANVGTPVTVTLTATDASGNSESATALVTVEDKGAPVVGVSLPDITSECAVTVTNIPTATDNCAGTIRGTTINPLTYNTQGTHTITWTYDDGNGNVATQTQQVIVKDVSKPVADIANLPDITGECGVQITTKPTATDNCAGSITATTTNPLTYAAQGTHTITWTYNDGNGNVATQTQKVIIKDVTKPTITAPAAITVSTDAGKCSVSNIALGTPVSSDNCAVASVTNNAPAVFNKGTTVVTWTAKDAAGNINTASQTVTVQDDEVPVVICPAAPSTLCYVASGTYNIAVLQASDNCGIASIGYTITGATNRTGTGANASGQFNPGTSTITWTVKDESGKTSTCQTNVVVNASMNVLIADVKALNNGVDVNTVYVGYAPASSITLTATAGGGSGSYTYTWSTGATTASIKVNPTVTATYTVTVTDAKGCAATVSKTVKVIDVRCGNKMDKVTVCHNGNTLCIDSDGVSDHLAHGDYLGACRAGVTPMTASASGIVKAAEEVEDLLRVTVRPNPSSNYFTLHITGNTKDKISVTVTDAAGRILEQRSNISNGQALRLGNAYRPGMYFARVMQGSQNLTVKLLKQAN